MDRKILKAMIILYPVLDMIYTITSEYLSINIPINQGIRLLFFGYLFIKFINTMEKLKITLLTILFSVGEYVYTTRYYGTTYIEDYQYILKILFFVTIIYAIKNILKRNIITVDELLKYSVIAAVIISVSVILSPLGLGLKTYEAGRFGYKGLFTIQNGITSMLLMIVPLNIYFLFKKRKIKYILSFFLGIFALLLIGTKAGLGGALLLIIMAYLFYLTKAKLTKLKVVISSFSMAFIVFIGYLNISTLKLLINNTKNSFYSWGENNVISYILSNRDLHLNWIKTYIYRYYEDNPLMYFGIGFSKANSILEQNGFHIIEMDFHAILYYSGIWILSIIIFIIGLRFLYSIILVFKNNFSIESIILLISLSAGIIHAYTGGHVIFEALTMLYFSLVIGIVDYRYHQVRVREKENVKNKSKKISSNLAKI